MIPLMMLIENRRLNREAFGLMRKIEGLSCDRRSEILGRYEKLLTNLGNQLPIKISNRLRDKIFAAESAFLTRLAEIEPNLKDDAVARQRMDELICQLEQLEEVFVSAAAEVVNVALEEGRAEVASAMSSELASSNLN